VEFERRIAERTGLPHAVAVSSGTAALHLIVRALEIGPGDEVLVPSFTFASSVNVILYERATPVFVDIEPDTYNLRPKDLASKLTPRSRAIMGVDIFGHPAEWDEIVAVARRRDLRVIEDACEALGAEYKGRKVGQFGDAAAFGFYPNKQITTGEGGMVVTNDAALAASVRSMRNQGRGEMGAWLEHERLGYNYRMDEMSAALGVTQLARLDSILARRDRVARMYEERLQGLAWVKPPVTRPHVRRSWFVYVVTLAEDLDRDRVMAAMLERGVPVRAYFSPIHRQPYIRQLPDYQDVRLPVTESVAGRTLALPFHNHLTEGEVDRVVEVLSEAVAAIPPLAIRSRRI
jgi:perosamine synthetase